MSVDPPSMVLDRAADSQSVPTLPAGVTSLYSVTTCGCMALLIRHLLELLGFDGIILEVTDVGDILTVMMF